MTLCACGCGQGTPLAKRTRHDLGHVRGQPLRFILGHNGRGANHGRWKGKPPRRQANGYVSVWVPGHPTALPDGYLAEHIVVAERALGRALPDGAEVHHHNQKRDDNRGGNLVVCQDRAYHMLLHQRMRALAASGHADWLKCGFCSQYDSPANLTVRARSGRRSGVSGFHASCRRIRRRLA